MECPLRARTSPAMLSYKTILPMLVVGVTLSTPVATSQSESQELGVETRPQDTPEVVLQLKYANGGLNKIYLTQFRHPNAGGLTAVSDRSALCSDLCHAGLGGAICGATCPKMMPVGLQSALDIDNDNTTAVEYGQPRVGVCPTLCENYLGQPLCPCGETADHSQGAVDWTSICRAFCIDGYLLTGCPTCSSEPRTVSVVTPTASLLASRVLNTPAGWSAWCDVQCRQGHGGAACNCDRTPF